MDQIREQHLSETDRCLYACLFLRKTKQLRRPRSTRQTQNISGGQRLCAVELIQASVSQRHREALPSYDYTHKASQNGHRTYVACF